jgi:hypothetical protein
MDASADAQPDAAAADAAAPSDASPDGSLDGAVSADAADGNPCAGLDSSIDVDQNGTADCVENVVKNSQFVSADSAWSPSQAEIDQSFSTQDANGSTGSGSLSVNNTYLVDASTVTGAGGSWQCIPVQSDKAYAVYAQYFIASGQAASGSASLNAIFYPTSTCLGAASGVDNSTSMTDTDAWGVVSSTFTVPTDANYVRLRLSVAKPQNEGPFTVLFDNVLVRLEP